MQPAKNTRERIVSIGLTCVVSLAALVAVYFRQTTWLEAAAFVTGVLCVWLVVKQNLWNFPVGIINVALYSVICYQSGLFADAGLQIVYFVLQLVGWYFWLRGGERHTELKVVRASTMELGVLAIFTAGVTLVLWRVLYHASGPVAIWDALTTAISLAAQILLSRKRLENWIGWIVVDIIYIPLYIYKELYLTAVLYAIFLTMAIIGLRAWRASWLAERDSRTEALPLPAEAT